MYQSKNFNGKVFLNPVPTTVMQPGKTWDTMKQWFLNSDHRVPVKKPGPFNPDLNVLNSSQKDALCVTWLGHSTVLIGGDGKHFLTDPVWSRHASPFSFAGPKRFFENPIKLKDLPKLDGIIISHDHYDHLDHSTIVTFRESDVPFYCPHGVNKLLMKWGINKNRIKTLDWWDEAVIDSTTSLVSAPARHFSGRGIFRNRTQWCSWIIKSKNYKVFFGGDSGYFPGFTEIGEKFGPFDLTMLEIGAFHPNWGQIHMGPENAIKAHLDLKGKILLPIHWGTFNLALHGWTEPIEQLISFAQTNQISLLIPRPGDCNNLKAGSVITEWWKEINQ